MAGTTMKTCCLHNTLNATPSLLIWGMLLPGMLPATAMAREWYIQPEVRVRTIYDDNIRLLSEQFDFIDKSAYGVITSVKSKMGVRTDVLDVAFEGKVNINRYFSDLDLDSTDYFLNLDTSFQVTERNTFGLSGRYIQDTTLTSELDVTGLVQENIPRQEWSVSPDWIYNLDESKFLQANYSHTDVSYDESLFSQFFDYTTDIASISFVHQWNPVLQNYVSFSAMLYEVPEISRDTREFTINIGSEYQISETWSASFSVGGRFTHTELVVQQPLLIGDLPVVANGEFVTEDVELKDDAAGVIFSFGTKKQFETGSAGISYTRTTSPQGNGRLVAFDTFNVNFNHKLTRHLHFLLNGGINISSASASQNLGNDRTYYHVTPTLRWNFNRQASISGSYRFRMQVLDRIDSTDQTAVSNAAFITFNYLWDKFSTQEF